MPSATISCCACCVMRISSPAVNPSTDFAGSYFTTVPVANRPSLPISYDLVTYPQGIARHERFKDEKFTAHDFWITRHDCPEKLYVYLGNYFYTPKGTLNPDLQPLDVQHRSSLE